MDDIIKKPLKRNAFCRGCDDEFSPGTEMISTYSHRNRGQYIYFCLKCAEFIGKLVTAKSGILVRNNVDNYPNTEIIMEPFRENLIDYLQFYYDNAEELADRLLKDGEIDIGDSSCTTFVWNNI